MEPFDFSTSPNHFGLPSKTAMDANPYTPTAYRKRAHKAAQ